MTDWVDFADDLQSILDEVKVVADEALEAGVKAGCEMAKDEWSAGAPRNTGAYAKSIRFRIEGRRGNPQGTVYSTKPGLPHLLEKGHAKVGGGRTRAIEHIAPAAEDAFEMTERVILETIGRSL